jgi:hypothetical protein
MWLVQMTDTARDPMLYEPTRPYEQCPGAVVYWDKLFTTRELCKEECNAIHRAEAYLHEQRRPDRSI